MTNQSETAQDTKAQKYCGGCGQKNFRPNRSLRELLSEFVEDWLGYDSKIYKTFSALVIPAKLSKDYFANSHHKNHYITPIRLYLLLSIIFFIMTQFAGMNLTEIEVSGLDQTNKSVPVQKVNPNNITVEPTSPASSASESPTLNTEKTNQVDNGDDFVGVQEDDGGFKVSFSDGGADFSLKDGCIKDPKDIFDFWPSWLDSAIDNSVTSICERFEIISYKPKEQQNKARAEFGLEIAQNIIEILPQVFFLSLPLLSLVLGLFYFLSRRLYVEHLVLLMHSHSFIFAVILFYLAWYKLIGAWPDLDIIPMGAILSIGAIIYLFLTQKWFYQRGWWSTIWRFSLFGFAYLILFHIIVMLAALVGLMAN